MRWVATNKEEEEEKKKKKKQGFGRIKCKENF